MEIFINKNASEPCMDMETYASDPVKPEIKKPKRKLPAFKPDEVFEEEKSFLQKARIPALILLALLLGAALIMWKPSFTGNVVKDAAPQSALEDIPQQQLAQAVPVSPVVKNQTPPAIQLVQPIQNVGPSKECVLQLKRAQNTAEGAKDEVGSKLSEYEEAVDRLMAAQQELEEAQQHLRKMSDEYQGVVDACVQ